MTSCTRQFKMRHRSLIVVVFKGLLLRSLSIVELKDLEEYVLAEGDAFSALMRKFATMDSVDGTITSYGLYRAFDKAVLTKIRYNKLRKFR